MTVPHASEPDRFDLTRFSLRDMTRCGIELRQVGAHAASMEEVAVRIASYFYDRLGDRTGERGACALVRVFVTLPYRALEAEQRAFAEAVLGHAPDDPRMKCLTLLGTRGDEAAWNSRHTSTGHRALPLPSATAVARSPMIAQLIRQLGVEIAAFLSPDGRLMVDDEQHTFNVFHVEEAMGSPYIPAQEEFVRPHGIRSVLGFGGLLPSGDLYATILFSRTHIPRDVADLFKTLALNVKVALLPFVDRTVFA
jgi:hypothetical protein